MTAKDEQIDGVVHAAGFAFPIDEVVAMSWKEGGAVEVMLRGAQFTFPQPDATPVWDRVWRHWKAKAGRAG